MSSRTFSTADFEVSTGRGLMRVEPGIVGGALTLQESCMKLCSISGISDPVEEEVLPSQSLKSFRPPRVGDNNSRRRRCRGKRLDRVVCAALVPMHTSAHISAKRKSNCSEPQLQILKHHNDIKQSPSMSDTAEVEVESPSGYMVLPKDVTAEIGSIKLFNKWSYEDVEVRDISLT